MKRMSVLVLATLFLACGGGSMLFAASAPAGATFFDDFSKGVARHFQMDRFQLGGSWWRQVHSFVSRLLLRDAADQSHADVHLDRRDLFGRRRVAVQKGPRLRNL